MARTEYVRTDFIIRIAADSDGTWTLSVDTAGGEIVTRDPRN
jgi:hypothetical protein